MKPVWVFVLLLLILCAATSLFLLNLSLSSYRNDLGFSSSRLLVFSVFNTVICAIFAQSYRPSDDVLDGFLPTLYSVYGAAEEEQSGEIDKAYENEDDDDDDENADDDRYYYGSDGYDEDDDDDGSDDVVGWDDDDEEEEKEECDDDLESRAEEFIAKVIRGWKEEQLMENLQKKHVD